MQSLNELYVKGGGLGGMALLSVPKKDSSSPWLSPCRVRGEELQEILGFSKAEQCTSPCDALTHKQLSR